MQAIIQFIYDKHPISACVNGKNNSQYFAYSVSQHIDWKSGRQSYIYHYPFTYQLYVSDTRFYNLESFHNCKHPIKYTL